MTAAFGQMVAVLARPPKTAPVRDGSRPRNGKTALLRTSLESGPKRAGELARIAELSGTGLVYGLLKHDITQGRVSLQDGLYSLVKQ